MNPPKAIEKGRKTTKKDPGGEEQFYYHSSVPRSLAASDFFSATPGPVSLVRRQAPSATVEVERKRRGARRWMVFGPPYSWTGNLLPDCPGKHVVRNVWSFVGSEPPETVRRRRFRKMFIFSSRNRSFQAQEPSANTSSTEYEAL